MGHLFLSGLGSLDSWLFSSSYIFITFSIITFVVESTHDKATMFSWSKLMWVLKNCKVFASTTEQKPLHSAEVVRKFQSAKVSYFYQKKRKKILFSYNSVEEFMLLQFYVVGLEMY